MHDLHLYGKGTYGYFWPMSELSSYDPTGVTQFTREPLCGHGVTAVTYQSTQANSNRGKHFIRCAIGKGISEDCGYWYWVHDIPRRTD